MPSLTAYTDLIEQFLSGRLSADRFEASFLSLFKGDQTPWRGAEYDALQSLFHAADAYTPDPAIRAPEDLDEDGLRAECTRALRRLQRSQPGLRRTA